MNMFSGRVHIGLAIIRFRHEFDQKRWKVTDTMLQSWKRGTDEIEIYL